MVVRVRGIRPVKCVWNNICCKILSTTEVIRYAMECSIPGKMNEPLLSPENGCSALFRPIDASVSKNMFSTETERCGTIVCTGPVVPWPWETVPNLPGLKLH